MEPNFPHFDSTSIIAPLNKKLQQTGQTENRTLNQLEIGFKHDFLSIILKFMKI